ncbi:MotA/TolQ/ExbB proton channel family protein [bacterium]|nr:MotA/TolQ/ExbB proton channel family protein [bacterium]MBU1752736.1 MotA/TolQ/ExbB proton channel family protein [bacterium]
MTINIFAVIRESFTMMILLVCSMVMLAFVIERWWFFHKISVDSNKFMDNIQRFINAGKFVEAASFCEITTGAVSAVVKTGLVNRYLHKPDLEELMISTRMEQMIKMERFLNILGTLGNISPLIGLFGTVVGIIRAFHDLAASGSGGPAVVAAGISEALVATAAGLMVAIPAVVFYNYFTKEMKTIVMNMDICSRRLLVMLTGGLESEQ